MAIGSLRKKPTSAFVKIFAPKERPHDNATLACIMAGDAGFLTFTHSDDRPVR